MRMRILIDIDGTIAAPNDAAIVKLCNEEWVLGICEEQLAQCKTLDDFKALPEVMIRREERGDVTFDYELGWMRFKPRVLMEDIALADAVAGVKQLSQIGTVSYLTARYSTSDVWQQGIVEGTQHWLEER